MELSGITSLTDRFMYLGIPITGRRARCSDYEEIERRVRQRIEGWQVTSLSMMARVTIIRSVLSSLPVYLLSNAVMPITCLRRIERCFRDFLWASMQEGHGIHLLSWDRVCMPINEGGLGIQSLIVRREALLARHASRFLLEPQSLWSSVMHARYGDWDSGSLIVPPRRSSSYWKEICRHSQVIMDNISWMIGDGSSIDVVKDTWISDLPFMRWPTFINVDAPPNLRVKDLISLNPRSWHAPSVTCYFGEELAGRISSLPLLPGSAVDSRLWQNSCLPKAPIRDLMDMFRPQAQCTEEAAWIWKLPVLPRVQLFIWKLLWNCLPTCRLLSRRGMSIQPSCPLCSEEEESVDHAIFLCARARRIWVLMGYNRDFDAFDFSRPHFLQEIRYGPLSRRGLWAVTAYHIWLSRNQIIFSNDRFSYHRVVRQIRSLASDCARGCNNVNFDFSGLWGSPAVPTANRRTVFFSWEPPPPGYVKINFDGSVRARAAGSAFIIRGPMGDLVAAGGFGSLDSSVPMTELCAAWAGLSYAIRVLHVRRFLLEGDSMAVISWLKEESCSDVSSNPTLRDCWSMLREADSALICHTYREANAAADWAAAFVAQHAGPWIWRFDDPCPSPLQHILSTDVSGLIHTRCV